MKCPKCQFENREGAKFCKECGSKMELQCPSCGFQYQPGDKFCDECGHNLSTPSAEPITKDLSFDEKLDKIQRYLPKGLTEKILSQRGKIEGERKQVTVMFCDMENYSQISETIGPEKAYDIMDEVYEILIHKVHDFEGTVNEMTGDGIMALFGAPMRTVFTSGDLKKAIEISSKIIHMIEKTHREYDFFGRPFNAYSEFLSHNGSYHENLGDFKKAEAMAEKSLRFAKEINHLPSIAHAEYLFSTVFSAKGDGRNCIKHVEEGMKYSAEIGFDFALPFANGMLGGGYFLLEEFQTAREFYQRAIQIQEDMGIQVFLASNYSSLALVETELGNFKSAQDYAEKGLDIAQKNSMRLNEGQAWIYLGRVLGKKKPAEFEKAEEYIRKGIDIIDEFELKPYLSEGYLRLGDLYNDMSRKDEALKYLKKVEGMYKEMGMDYYLEKTQKLLEKIQ